MWAKVGDGMTYNLVWLNYFPSLYQPASIIWTCVVFGMLTIRMGEARVVVYHMPCRACITIHQSFFTSYLLSLRPPYSNGISDTVHWSMHVDTPLVLCALLFLSAS